jgi:hypothetical protein
VRQGRRWRDHIARERAFSGNGGGATTRRYAGNVRAIQTMLPTFGQMARKCRNRCLTPLRPAGRGRPLSGQSAAHPRTLVGHAPRGRIATHRYGTRLGCPWGVAAHAASGRPSVPARSSFRRVRAHRQDAGDPQRGCSSPSSTSTTAIAARLAPSSTCTSRGTNSRARSSTASAGSCANATAKGPEGTPRTNWGRSASCRAPSCSGTPAPWSRAGPAPCVGLPAA